MTIIATSDLKEIERSLNQSAKANRKTAERISDVDIRELLIERAETRESFAEQLREELDKRVETVIEADPDQMSPLTDLPADRIAEGMQTEDQDLLSQYGQAIASATHDTETKQILAAQQRTIKTGRLRTLAAM